MALGVVLTSDRVNSFSPAWDPAGDFLYFLSDRNLSTLVSGPWGPRAPEPFFDRENEIFHLSLRAGLRSPFAPDDELTPKEDRGSGEARDSSDAGGGGASRASSGNRGTTPAPVEIDMDGLMGRVKQVPVRAGNYRGLTVNEGSLFFMDSDVGQRGGGRLTALAIENEKEPELIVVAEGVSSFEMSADGKKLLLRQGSNIFVVDARPSRVSQLNDHIVDLSGWSFPIDVREDWRQLFIDAWRLERDYFYDPGMHGNDWEAVRDKFLPLVDRVTTRDELSDIIGRVVGELSALHTAVRGGDMRSGEDNVRVASLGARLVRSPDQGGYLIDYIYRHDPDYPDEASPLADPDLGISEGDVILAVNGQEVLSVWDIGALLRNQSRQVRLHLRPKAGGETRDVMVTPTFNESNLRYADWEYTRRMAVEDEGDGQIGYLHLRAMTGGNINEFYRNFYPVFDRQGLIVDVRRNSGGNIDSVVLEKLMRQAWMYWKDRAGEPTWNMQYAFRGYMVVLVDQNTASDGEAFAEGFRRLGLGPVIGERTWGGEIWLSGQQPPHRPRARPGPHDRGLRPRRRMAHRADRRHSRYRGGQPPPRHIQRGGRTAGSRHPVSEAEDRRGPPAGAPPTALSGPKVRLSGAESGDGGRRGKVGEEAKRAGPVRAGGIRDRMPAPTRQDPKRPWHLGQVCAWRRQGRQHVGCPCLWRSPPGVPRAGWQAV